MSRYKVTTNYSNWKQFQKEESNFKKNSKVQLVYKKQFGILYDAFMAVYSRVCSVLGREFTVTVYNTESPDCDDLKDLNIVRHNEENNLLISLNELIAYNVFSRINPSMEKHHFNELLKTSNNRRIERLNIALKKKINGKTIKNADLRSFIQQVSHYGGPSMKSIFVLSEQPTKGLESVLNNMRNDQNISDQSRDAIGLVIELLIENRSVIFPNKISDESPVAVLKYWNKVFQEEVQSMIDITTKFNKMKRSSNKESNYNWNIEELQNMSGSFVEKLTGLKWLHNSHVSNLRAEEKSKYTLINNRMGKCLDEINSKIAELNSG